MKMDIAIAVPGLPFNGETFDKQSLGGSESAGYYMARALAKRGHRVSVFCNTERKRCADVDYLPLSIFQRWAEYTQHDVTIVQRMPELFSCPVRSRFSMLWCHDLATRSAEQGVKGLTWNLDRVAVLSAFMREQYKQVYGLPDEVLYQTRNGVSLETVAQVKEKIAGFDPRVDRNALSLLYTARPERGLDVLLEHIMPRILQQEPNARLFLASYYNPVDHLAEFYGQCKAMADRLGDRVVYLGHLPKDKLYEVMQLAGLLLYPLPSRIAPTFDEVSCITAMEAQACGLPMVTASRGALPETLAQGAGLLIPEEPFTEAYYEAFAGAALRLMRDPEAWKAASEAGLERAPALSWDGVAAEWEELFLSSIKAKSADLATVANDAWRRSDIYLAREALKRLPEDDEKSRYVRERVMQDWAFLDEEDGFRKQYERIGSTHNPEVINWSPNEPRYAAVRQWLMDHFNALRAQDHAAGLQPRESLSVLDYGCAHGGYAINLLKELPFLRITGVDIDLHGINLAYGFAEKLGVSERWRGVVGSWERLSDPNVPEMQEEYDVVMAQEVMEHVSDPTGLLQALEQRVRDGGVVYITVPSGPWEYTDYLRFWGGLQGPASPKGFTGYPYRAHLWEFDLHDLGDLLDVKGAEAEVNQQMMSFGLEPNTGGALGWWIVNYKVTEATRGKVGTIDMERKLWLQRPRQTVSVGIIAGGPMLADTLHWCLRSLNHLADEIIIADCGGMDDECLRILSTYDSRVRVIPGVDPKVEGFETPRNLVLQAATQDWFLWIDVDEKLLNGERAHKYLRHNMFQGYSIKQHHFACDTRFDADMPVRLFRNNGKLRFFGMIHEHPESALNAGPGITIVIGDVHIPHVGYLLEPGRQVKFNRNLPMLERDIAKYPERRLQKHFIMRDKMLLVSYELTRNGGRMTEALRIMCQEVIALWRQHFRGQGHFTNVDPIVYYDQAVKLLGEGFSMGFSLAADKMQANLNGGAVIRFATPEDAEVEIAHRARQLSQPFQTAYW